jgi:hypothetical protein
MRHYVVVFLESRLFPGTWVTDHFVRSEEREDVPELPETLFGVKHRLAVKLLTDWQNEAAPNPAWTLEECLLGRVALLTVIWYGDQESIHTKAVRYPMVVLPGSRV